MTERTDLENISEIIGQKEEEKKLISIFLFSHLYACLFVNFEEDETNN